MAVEEIGDFCEIFPVETTAFTFGSIFNNLGFVLSPPNHGSYTLGRCYGYSINRTVDSAKMTYLAILLICDRRLFGIFFHPEYIHRTCFNACATTNAFLFVYIFYWHYIPPIIDSAYLSPCALVSGFHASGIGLLYSFILSPSFEMITHASQFLSSLYG